MKMTNRWNRFIYRLWALVYDATVNHLFMPGRRQAMDVYLSSVPTSIAGWGTCWAIAAGMVSVKKRVFSMAQPGRFF